MKNKYIKLVPYYLIVLIYLEFIFRICIAKSGIGLSIINTLFFLLPIAVIMSLLSRLFANETINRWVIGIITFILSFWFCVEAIFKKIYDVYFSISSLVMADQAAAFAGTAVSLIVKNFVYVILLFVPFILFLCLNKKLHARKQSRKHAFLMLIITIITSFLFLLSLGIKKSEIYSPYDLYFKKFDNTINKQTLGVMLATHIDVNNILFPKTEGDLIITDTPKKPIKEEIKYNNLNIDFNSLIETETNSTLKKMHTYFNNESGTKQNEYTGMFKDKNLIFFLAESFNSIAVDETLTPTLYKLINSGFTFENFYSPVILSTIGGEFQELISMVPNQKMLNTWRKGVGYYPYTAGTLFTDAGYSVRAYHNNAYKFQGRNKYLANAGFDNYVGCGNGLEKVMNCKKWPESDVEMIEGTVNDYINEERFMTYYVTVSGHFEYSKWNAMANKNYSIVKDLPYTDRVRYYLATQVELNNALDLLIQKLTEAGKLDDTVIVLVGDHYPYGLTLDEINEVAEPNRDSIVEINRSNLIIWNNGLANKTISKVGSQIDVMPTVYNLFGLPYDSRLVLGKDILSDTPGVAITSNRSWVSDKGTYFSSSRKFVPRSDVTVEEDYVKNMNTLVSNRIEMGSLIVANDYYDKILGE